MEGIRTTLTSSSSSQAPSYAYKMLQIAVMLLNGGQRNIQTHYALKSLSLVQKTCEIRSSQVTLQEVLRDFA